MATVCLEDEAAVESFSDCLALLRVLETVSETTCRTRNPDGRPMKTKEQVMNELQSPQRKSYTAKTIFGLLLAVVMVAAFATAGSAENTGTPRIGWLHITKECS